VSNAPLGLSFNASLWFCRQLQNRRMLASTQCRQEHDPATGKFQRIVMRRDFIFVDLPKDRCLVVDYFYRARLMLRCLFFCITGTSGRTSAGTYKTVVCC
jgi:hypothetical protein